MKYLLLIYEFFKTGLFSVGGGLATLPFLSQMGEKYGWFTQEELANMLAVSESTPGPIGVNMATYAGNTSAGILGGLAATLSLVLPSYIMILIVSKIMSRFRDNRYVLGAMEMLRPASVGMVAAAVIGVLESVLLNMDAVRSLNWLGMVQPICLLLFAVLLFGCLRFKKLHPAVFLAVGAVFGIVLKL